MTSDDVVLIACMKDEGPFILEWVAYYKTIGVSQIVVVTNDCSDGTDQILDRLDEMGLVRHVPNPTMVETFTNTVQNVALKYAALQKEVREAGWILVVDADEFLNIRVGNNDLPSLFDALGAFDAISFNQVVFGSNGIEKFADKPVMRQFDMRFEYEADPRQFPMMYGLKTLSRNDEELFSRYSNHLPRLKSKAESSVRWLDGSGRQMHPDFVQAQPRSYPVYMKRVDVDGVKKGKKRRQMFPVEPGTHSVGYVNHYSLRSLESFVMQSLRGDAVNAEVRRDIGYWRSYDRNGVQDKTIYPMSRKSDAWREDLLKDRRLAHLHEQAVAYHRKIYAQMIKKPAVQQLVEDCRAEMAKIVRP